MAKENKFSGHIELPESIFRKMRFLADDLGLDLSEVFSEQPTYISDLSNLFTSSGDGVNINDDVDLGSPYAVLTDKGAELLQSVLKDQEVADYEYEQSLHDKIDRFINVGKDKFNNEFDPKVIKAVMPLINELKLSGNTSFFEDNYAELAQPMYNSFNEERSHRLRGLANVEHAVAEAGITNLNERKALLNDLYYNKDFDKARALLKDHPELEAYDLPIFKEATKARDKDEKREQFNYEEALRKLKKRSDKENGSEDLHNVVLKASMPKNYSGGFGKLGKGEVGMVKGHGFALQDRVNDKSSYANHPITIDLPRGLFKDEHGGFKRDWFNMLNDLTGEHDMYYKDDETGNRVIAVIDPRELPNFNNDLRAIKGNFALSHGYSPEFSYAGDVIQDSNSDRDFKKAKTELDKEKEQKKKFANRLFTKMIAGFQNMYNGVRRDKDGNIVYTNELDDDGNLKPADARKLRDTYRGRQILINHGYDPKKVTERDIQAILEDNVLTKSEENALFTAGNATDRKWSELARQKADMNKAQYDGTKSLYENRLNALKDRLSTVLQGYDKMYNDPETLKKRASNMDLRDDAEFTKILNDSLNGIYDFRKPLMSNIMEKIEGISKEDRAAREPRNASADKFYNYLKQRRETLANFEELKEIGVLPENMTYDQISQLLPDDYPEEYTYSNKRPLWHLLKPFVSNYDDLEAQVDKYLPADTNDFSLQLHKRPHSVMYRTRLDSPNVSKIKATTKFGNALKGDVGRTVAEMNEAYAKQADQAKEANEAMVDSWRNTYAITDMALATLPENYTEQQKEEALDMAQQMLVKLIKNCAKKKNGELDYIRLRRLNEDGPVWNSALHIAQDQLNAEAKRQEGITAKASATKAANKRNAYEQEQVDKALAEDLRSHAMHDVSGGRYTPSMLGSVHKLSDAEKEAQAERLNTPVKLSKMAQDILNTFSGQIKAGKMSDDKLERFMNMARLNEYDKEALMEEVNKLRPSSEDPYVKKLSEHRTTKKMKQNEKLKEGLANLDAADGDEDGNIDVGKIAKVIDNSTIETKGDED